MASGVDTVSQNPAVKELKAFIRHQRDGRQVKKALAVKLSYQGHHYESIAEILDVSLGAISKWKQAYEENGLEGFRPQHQGRKGLLSAQQREAVLAWLQQKNTWQLGELEAHLEQEYNVTYESKQSYYDLFSAAGISWKKATAVNPKADRQKVAAKKSRSKICWRATGRRLRQGD